MNHRQGAIIMSLIDQINNDLKISMQGGDKLRTQVLRGLKSAIKYAEIESSEPLGDQDILAVITKQAKQRRDSIDQFKKGGRDDLVKNEQAELDIIESYLPEQMSEEKVRAKVAAVIADLGVSDMKAMGQVMKQAMIELKGQVDGKVVNQIVRELLSK
jgi:uncharacterized protein YqeY